MREEFKKLQEQKVVNFQISFALLNHMIDRIKEIGLSAEEVLELIDGQGTINDLIEDPFLLSVLNIDVNVKTIITDCLRATVTTTLAVGSISNEGDSEANEKR